MYNIHGCGFEFRIFVIYIHVHFGSEANMHFHLVYEGVRWSLLIWLPPHAADFWIISPGFIVTGSRFLQGCNKDVVNRCNLLLCVLGKASDDWCVCEPFQSRMTFHSISLQKQWVHITLLHPRLINLTQTKLFFLFYFVDRRRSRDHCISPLMLYIMNRGFIFNAL